LFDAGGYQSTFGAGAAILVLAGVVAATTARASKLAQVE
jgi:hypothetical protein